MPKVAVVINCLTNISSLRNLFEICSFRQYDWMEWTVTLISTTAILITSTTECLHLAFSILTGGPHIVIFVHAKDFPGFPAIGHANLERIIFITISILVSAIRKVSEEHIAGCVDFAVLCQDDEEVLATCAANYLVAIFNAEVVAIIVVVVPSVEFVLVMTNAGSPSHHVSTALPLPEKFTVFSDNSSEELAMANIYDALHLCWGFNSSKFLFVFVITLCSEAHSPDWIIAALNHKGLM